MSSGAGHPANLPGTVLGVGVKMPTSTLYNQASPSFKEGVMAQDKLSAHALGTARKLSGLMAALPEDDETAVLKELLGLFIRKTGKAVGAPQVIETEAPKVIGSNGHQPRTLAPGSFNTDRHRTVKYRGKSFEVDTMAEAIVHMLDTHWLDRTDVDPKEFGKAVKDAYPENTYGAHRVDFDYGKYLKGQFTVQKHRGYAQPPRKS